VSGGTLVGGALFGLALGCGGGSLSVPSYPHPEGVAGEAVTLMPPPAQIEHLDAQPPAPGCLWADGQWVWAVQRWDWRPGGWILPPSGCRYSAPTVGWVRSGEQGILYYRPGRWYSVGQPRTCPAAVSCPTQSPIPAQPEASSGS